MNWPFGALMNTVPETGLTSPLCPGTGGGGAGAAAVVKVWSGPNVVPAALVATSLTWYSAPGISPVSGAVIVWLLVSEPICWVGVDWSYSVVSAPGPRWLRSRPYWKNACVGIPSGLTRPEGVAPLAVWLVGAPPVTAGA